MVGPSILLESGTNEVELIELYLDQDLEGEVIRRSFGVNVAKVKKIIKQADAKNFSGKKKGNADHRENTIMENPMVMGMYEFMGKVIPLIDLSKWLEMPTLESNKKMVVITEFNNLVSSFLVSGVNRIHRIHWDDISPLDDNMLKFAGDTIIGTVSLDNPKRIMQVLDLERAVADLNPSFACEPVEAIKETFPTEFKAVAADDSLSMRKAV